MFMSSHTAKLSTSRVHLFPVLIGSAFGSFRLRPPINVHFLVGPIRIEVYSEQLLTSLDGIHPLRYIAHWIADRAGGHRKGIFRPRGEAVDMNRKNKTRFVL